MKNGPAFCRHNHILLKVVPVCIVFLLFLAGCPDKNDDAVTTATYNYAKESEPTTYVDVLEASKSNLIPVINASGIVKGIHETFVVSETQGVIEKVFFSIYHWWILNERKTGIMPRRSGMNRR